MSTRRTASAGLLAAALLLAGCSAGGDSSTSTGPSGPGSVTGGGETPGGGPKPYLPVPDGVVLADPGSQFGLGETANVAWRLGSGGGVGVLAVRVRKLVKGDIGDLEFWQLDPRERRSALYFVTMTVANVGDTDLSGLRIPLYVLDGAGQLVESSAFESDFDPCASDDLPAGFVTGEKVTVCQAYLVPQRGALKAVAFRATRTFNPVTWVGKVTVPKRPRKSDAAQ